MIYDIAQSKNISIEHVSSHQNPKNPEATQSQVADHLARINIAQDSEAEQIPGYRSGLDTLGLMIYFNRLRGEDAWWQKLWQNKL